MKKLIFLVCVYYLSGCTTPYVAPTSGPTAKIRFNNESQRNLKISFFENSSGCERRRFNKPIPPNNSETYTVYADKELTFEYYLTNFGGGGYSEQYCLVNLRFLPIANSEYLFRTIESLNSCKWVMLDNTDKNQSKLVNLEKVTWQRGFSEESSFCDK